MEILKMSNHYKKTTSDIRDKLIWTMLIQQWYNKGSKSYTWWLINTYVKKLIAQSLIGYLISRA